MPKFFKIYDGLFFLQVEMEDAPAEEEEKKEEIQEIISDEGNEGKDVEEVEEVSSIFCSEMTRAVCYLSKCVDSTAFCVDIIPYFLSSKMVFLPTVFQR